MYLLSMLSHWQFVLFAVVPAEYVQRYANPDRAPSSKASDDGSDKMEEDGQGAAVEDDSDDGFLSSSEEEEH